MKIKDDPEVRELLENENAALFQEERDTVRQEAKQAIVKIQEENRRAYNKKRRSPNKYQEGDLVAIRRRQGEAGLKFAAKYFGPYRIKR